MPKSLTGFMSGVGAQKGCKSAMKGIIAEEHREARMRDFIENREEIERDRRWMRDRLHRKAVEAIEHNLKKRGRLEPCKARRFVDMVERDPSLGVYFPKYLEKLIDGDDPIATSLMNTYNWFRRKYKEFQEKGNNNGSQS